MGLSRRSSRRGGAHSNIWPGFVDAVTTLLMVLMFIVTIFTVVQSVLRDRITAQDSQLNDLTGEVSDLNTALGLARSKVASLQSGLDEASQKASQQDLLIASLNSQLKEQSGKLSDANARITDFEAQVARLISQRDDARGEVADLSSERDRIAGQKADLEQALASARSEVDAQTEAARLAAARREAVEALLADLRKTADQQKADLAATQEKLSDAETAKLADAAAAEALRDKLKNANDELTAMTLALEDQRKRAEDTLTLLAAAKAAQKDLDQQLQAALADQGDAPSREDMAAALAAKLKAQQQAQDQMSEAEKQRTLLAAANKELSDEKAASADSQRKMALLNEQVATLRGQLSSLQETLDASKAKDDKAQVQIENLGSQLNTALAQVAAEQKQRAALEEAERKRLQKENQELSRYRSEFFGKLSQVLAGQDGVRIVGDRFVFSSEVLFATGAADLSAAGKAQIADVVKILKDVAPEIPSSINWIIRVDGHTDDVPLSGNGQFKDNWELSQARALSVVRYMVDDLGFPPDRLAATGFGQYQPVAQGDSPEARAQNRRIELKLTER